MRRTAAPLVLFCFTFASLSAQETNMPARVEKRGWLGRVLHPFRSESAAPAYKDQRLRGLVLNLQLSPQPVKLSEVRQLEVHTTLTNTSKRAIELEFPTDQRLEIYLRNTSDVILTKWSDNRIFAEKLGSVFINPQEHVDYSETIATRELTPNKVFVAEVFFPKYPELRVRQKFLTAP
ncbi:MAG: BsuPI-related putative proteinase inhibitor [Chthoniobacterales bacterium]